METTKCDRIENTRCRICVLVFLVSFVLGKIALIAVVHPNIALRIYIAGWVILVVGVILCGKQGRRCATNLCKKYEITILEFLKRRISRHIKFK